MIDEIFHHIRPDLSVPGGACGGGPVRSRLPGPAGAFTILFENDILGGFGEDKHYTQGTRFSWLSPEAQVWHWVEAGAQKLPFFPDDAHLRATYSLGQNLYTPEDIKTTELIVDDRPYAGWLYAAVGWWPTRGKVWTRSSFR